jgi:hypothetical protein
MQEGALEGIGVSLLFMMVITLAMTIVAIWPTTTDKPDKDAKKQFAVIYAPGTSPVESVQKLIRAGGKPVRYGAFDFIIIGATKDRNFSESAYRHGAWLVFDPAIKGSCFSVSNNLFTQAQKT